MKKLNILFGISLFILGLSFLMSPDKADASWNYNGYQRAQFYSPIYAFENARSYGGYDSFAFNRPTNYQSYQSSNYHYNYNYNYNYNYGYNSRNNYAFESNQDRYAFDTDFRYYNGSNYNNNYNYNNSYNQGESCYGYGC